MQKKLIIFDMDGTLINSSLTIANAINYVRGNLGFEDMAQEYILSRINDHTINSAQIFYHAKSFHKDHERWFSEYYSKNHDKELVLYEGVKQLLADLKSDGYSLAVATNAYRNSTIESLTHLRIYDYFDAIICYDDVSRGKPHPDMLYGLLDQLDLSKQESLFIGDGPRDQLAAEAAEMDYIMVNWGFTKYENSINSIKELKGLLKNV